MKLTELLQAVNFDTMETEYVDYGAIAEEFQIQDYLEVKQFPKLSRCPVHIWVCTDTEVGIYVWFNEIEWSEHNGITEVLHAKTVCIELKLYRKSAPVFYWLHEEAVRRTESYLRSLTDEADMDNFVFAPEDVSEILNSAEELEHKKYEKKYI